MTTWVLYRVLLAVDVIVIAVGSLMPPRHYHVGTGWDKADHFIIYASLAFLICLNFQNAKRRIPALLVGIAFGALMEMGQSLVPGRQASILDQLANTIGILIGYGLFLLLGRKFELLFSRFFKE